MVTQTARDEKYHLSAIDENGDICQGDITIESGNVIKSIALFDNQLTIEFNPFALKDDLIGLHPLFETGDSYCMTVMENTEQITIPTVDLTPGLYILLYTSQSGYKESIKIEIN